MSDEIDPEAMAHAEHLMNEAEAWIEKCEAGGLSIQDSRTVAVSLVIATLERTPVKELQGVTLAMIRTISNFGAGKIHRLMREEVEGLPN